MFGIIYGLITFLGSGYEHLRRHKATKDGEKRGWDRIAKGNNPCGVYYDWQGHERDLYTGKKVTVWREKGHTIVKEVGGSVLRDITQIENDRCNQELIKNGAKVIKIFEGEKDSQKYKGIVSEWERRTGQKWRMADGQPFFDFSDAVYYHCKTKRYCIIRWMKFRGLTDKNLKDVDLIENAESFYVDYYVDIHTGEVLDRVDSSPKVRVNGEQKDMSIEDEQKGIELYQKLRKEGKIYISKRQIGYKHSLTSVLPQFYEG